jgi:hypothetical protein
MAAAKKEALEDGASSGHITNLKQSILETFDIYASFPFHSIFLFRTVILFTFSELPYMGSNEALSPSK